MKVDVAIVGGRCAGSVLALRLARAGARVAIVDRDQIGTDTLSTHAIWPNTLARLDELGVLETLMARHDVPLVRYRLRVLGRELVGDFTPIERLRPRHGAPAGGPRPGARRSRPGGGRRGPLRRRRCPTLLEERGPGARRDAGERRDDRGRLDRGGRRPRLDRGGQARAGEGAHAGQRHVDAPRLLARPARDRRAQPRRRGAARPEPRSRARTGSSCSWSAGPPSSPAAGRRPASSAYLSALRELPDHARSRRDRRGRADHRDPLGARDHAARVLPAAGRSRAGP